MTEFHTRCLRTSFPFLDLPGDVQVLIMSNMDLHTLQSTTQAIPSAKNLYLDYPSSILHGTIASMGCQISNLLLTTYSLTCAIKASEVYEQPEVDNMDRYLAQSLDTLETRKIDLLDYDPLGVLHALCEIDEEVVSLVQDFAKNIYENACHRDNPGAIPPPMILSRTENYRMTRSFYRLKLFGVLFYDYADWFHIDLEPCYDAFFFRLRTFEIDELVTAYQWLFRERRYYRPTIAHEGCSYSSLKPWTNSDPFNCKTCRGLYTSIESREFARRRRVQPFWYTASKFLDQQGLWADPDHELCINHPVKVWEEAGEANESNAGWSSWSQTHLNSACGVLRQTYVSVFRILGYCFWDKARLEGWSDMYSYRWLREEERRSKHAWCQICRSYDPEGDRT